MSVTLTPQERAILRIFDGYINTFKKADPPLTRIMVSDDRFNEMTELLNRMPRRVDQVKNNLKFDRGYIVYRDVYLYTVDQKVPRELSEKKNRVRICL